jgi:hypothetical protein
MKLLVVLVALSTLFMLPLHHEFSLFLATKRGYIMKLQIGDPMHVFEGGMSSSSSICSCIGCQVDYCSCDLK